MRRIRNWRRGWRHIRTAKQGASLLADDIAKQGTDLLAYDIAKQGTDLLAGKSPSEAPISWPGISMGDSDSPLAGEGAGRGAAGAGLFGFQAAFKDSSTAFGSVSP